MEIRSLKSPSVTAVPASFSRRGLIGRGFVTGRVFRYSKSGGGNGNLRASRLRIVSVRPQASGDTGSRSVSVTGETDTVDKDEDLVFVAGATGRVGSCTVRELLKLGFRVKAGVRNVKKAEALIESVKTIKDASSTVQPVERLELVECDLEKPETIGPALGKASVVICCIGASEKEVFDVTGPYRIDYLATKNLVDAAAAAKVKHFIMVSSLGTNKIGFPAYILNLFWGVLCWKRKAEEALIASGIPYTIVRPGGMERPTDAYKETHNITLAEEDTLFGGQVSNLQVAELLAFMAKNRRLSYCKVVEVIAETTAPLRPMDELLVKIPYQRLPPKELDVTVRSSPELPQESASEPPSDPVEEPAETKPVEASATVTRPLSPFTAYEDLKPPSSPTPIPSGSRDIAATASPPGQTLTGIPLSASTPDQASPPTSGSSLTGQDATKREAPRVATQYLSPYYAYEDFKPPASPSPAPPAAHTLPSSSSNGGVPGIATTTSTEGPPAEASEPAPPTDELQSPKQKSTPLSPFTMYEDLKPPSSPVPSPGKG
uniref:NAD(P)-binding domain-containing protein n=1 Tax=Kalanchoe fedtschenkoi TaxID=63787 RepID=A0A7N0T265_KALFE